MSKNFYRSGRARVVYIARDSSVAQVFIFAIEKKRKRNTRKTAAISFFSIYIVFFVLCCAILLILFFLEPLGPTFYISIDFNTILSVLDTSSDVILKNVRIDNRSILSVHCFLAALDLTTSLKR